MRQGVEGLRIAARRIVQRRQFVPCIGNHTGRRTLRLDQLAPARCSLLHATGTPIDRGQGVARLFKAWRQRQRLLGIRAGSLQIVQTFVHLGQSQQDSRTVR